MPIFEIESYGAWGGEVELDNVSFINFSASTACEGKQTVIVRNPSAADYIPAHSFNNTHFVNVSAERLVWIEKPNPEWAAVDPTMTINNCGNWPCTAPENVVLKFEGTTFEGGDLTGESAFQITSGHEDVASAFDTCELKDSW